MSHVSLPPPVQLISAGGLLMTSLTVSALVGDNEYGSQAAMAMVMEPVITSNKTFEIKVRTTVAG